MNDPTKEKIDYVMTVLLTHYPAMTGMEARECAVLVLAASALYDEDHSKETT